MANPALPTVRIQREDFDLQKEIDFLTDGHGEVGAVVSFIGLCRDEKGSLSALELEHYPGMAEDEITRIAVEALQRWNLIGLTAIHRFGKLEPGENIVLVVAASAHRQAAFDGANYLMDFLKTRAPFWKKEYLRDGTSGKWVDAKDADDDALTKWQTE